VNTATGFVPSSNSPGGSAMAGTTLVELPPSGRENKTCLCTPLFSLIRGHFFGPLLGTTHLGKLESENQIRNFELRIPISAFA